MASVLNDDSKWTEMTVLVLDHEYIISSDCKYPAAQVPIYIRTKASVIPFPQVEFFYLQ